MGLTRAALGAVFIWTTGVAAPPGAEGAEPLSIPAVAIEMARLPATSFTLMQRELDTLIGGADLRVRWRRDSPAAETAADELRVVFLDGPGRGLYAGRPVLAASRHTDPGPTIWVYTPNVLAALGPTAGGRDSPDRQRGLGLALVRVLAHELVHVLAPEMPHGHGVMADRFRLVALEQTRPQLVPACARALVQGARDWATRGGRTLRQEASAGASHLSDTRP